MESPSAGSYHPTQSPNQHNTSSHQPVPVHTTQPSPAPSGSKEWAKLLVTRMEEQEYNKREIENRKTYLENIKVYEGTDKQKCLPWVNRLQQAAKCSNTSLRAALLARAGTTVFGIVAATPENIDDLEMKKVVLRNFSDIATPTEAAQKLRNMKMTSDQAIASYNYNYAALHEAAFDINPSEQRMRFALEDYANSVPEYTADKLSYKIVKVNSWIKTLQDVMDHAVKIDQESRQSKVMRNRRNNSSELIDTTVNEISDIDINYVTSRQGDSRFNSTMKPGYQREGKDFSPRNRQNDSFRNSRGWNSPRNNNQNFRKINKYKHHARGARNNIKFKYTISRGEKEIMRTLRNMIHFFKGKTDKVVEDIKKMPKVNPRGVNEVSEDSIATIYHHSIAFINSYNPDEYFTSIPEPTEICRIDDTLGSERGTVFKINIANREVFTLFDTGASRSVMSGETFRKLKLDNKHLDTKKLPTVVGANGTSLGAIGRINCEIEIGKKKFKQTFLVCENLTRSLILGVDLGKQHAAGVQCAGSQVTMQLSATYTP